MPKVFEERLSDLAGTNTLIGWYAFLAFAVAALAQLVVGHLVDNYSIRTVFACIAALQAVLFGVMQHLTGAAALLVAVCFMLAVFGQIPINDVLIGRATSSAWRSRAYSIRFVITFAVAATAVPMIAFIRARWDFAALFLVLALAASAIFVAALLPSGHRDAVPHGSPIIQLTEDLKPLFLGRDFSGPSPVIWRRRLAA